MQLSRSVFTALLKFILAITAIVFLLNVAARAWGINRPSEGVLLFSTPVDLTPPNASSPSETEWQVRVLDLNTGFSLNVWDYRNNILAVPYQWSPQGRLVAGQNGNEGIVVLNILRRDIAFTLEGAYRFVWSPDGNQFAVMKSQAPGYRIYIGNSADASMMPISTSLTNSMYPTWSGDGRQLAFYSEDDFSIHVVDVDGTQERQLTSSVSRSDQDNNPVWSPDGRFIAYVTPSQTDSQFSFSLQVIKPDEPEQAVFSYTHNGLLGQAMWSPDSRYIAFIAHENDTNEDDLYVLDTQGNGAVRKLADNLYYIYDVTWNLWSPDSRYIAFSPHLYLNNIRKSTVVNELYRVEVVTGEITKIADIAAAFPTWQPSVFD